MRIHMFVAMQRTIAFIDPSAFPSNPGWSLRNLLAYMHALHPTEVSSGLRVLCWRDSEAPTQGHAWKSRFGTLNLGNGAPAQAPTERPTAVGWEKSSQGKLAPRMVDLAPMMDPTRYAPPSSLISTRVLLIRH